MTSLQFVAVIKREEIKILNELTENNLLHETSRLRPVKSPLSKYLLTQVWSLNRESISSCQDIKSTESVTSHNATGLCHIVFHIILNILYFQTNADLNGHKYVLSSQASHRSGL